MRMLLLVLLTLATTVHAQNAPGGGKTIEGFWQDEARRILFARDAPPGYVYGRWTQLDPRQTYPTAKQIRRNGGSLEVIDLLYDEEHPIRIVSWASDRIEFVRSSTYPQCGMRHSCRIGAGGDEMICALENVCRVADRAVPDWRGEERYVRRAYCERDVRREAQGIPHWCR